MGKSNEFKFLELSNVSVEDTDEDIEIEDDLDFSMFLRCCVDYATQQLYFSLNQKKLKNNKTRILESKSNPTFVVASKKKARIRVKLTNIINA